MYLPAAGDDSPVQKISDVIEGRESRLFRETPAGFAYGDDHASKRYAEALAGLGLKPGDGVGALGLLRMLGLRNYASIVNMEAAVAQNQPAGAVELIHQAEVVRRDHHRRPRFVEFGEEPQQPAREAWIDIAGRLIGQQ